MSDQANHIECAYLYLDYCDARLGINIGDRL